MDQIRHLANIYFASVSLHIHFSLKRYFLKMYIKLSDKDSIIHFTDSITIYENIIHLRFNKQKHGAIPENKDE